jgi:hypothetical protein
MPIMARQFRFSTWNLLSAMFWLSVGAGAFAVLRSLDEYPTHEWPKWVLVTLVLSYYALIVASPLIAIGALFGRTRTAVIVAFFVEVVLLWLLLPEIR